MRKRPEQSQVMLEKPPFSDTLQSRTLFFVFNFCLAIVIFANAEAGRLLGIRNLPLHISIFWPATGFALAAILLYGFRVWPGIFLGNFVYNTLYLFLSGGIAIGPAISALSITLGSLIQAVVGGYLIRRLSSKTYFSTVKDVTIFLFFGGIVTCMIASAIGTCTLYLAGTIPWHNTLYVWATFWLGDTMGVYIFVPLIVIWALQRPAKVHREGHLEAICMAICFVAISLLSFGRGYPVAHLFIPLGIWVSYRFRLHGATITVLCLGLLSIIPILQGYGSSIGTLLNTQPLIVISFLEIIAATSLIVAASASNERAAV